MRFTNNNGGGDNIRLITALYKHLGPTGGDAAKEALSVLRHPLQKKHELDALAALAGQDKGATPLVDAARWQKAFGTLYRATSNPTYRKVVEAFYTAPLTLEKRAEHAGDGVILICMIKNDMTHLPAFYAHYRGIGVGHFAMLDNGSTDGTREYLAAQPDTDLYTTAEAYNSQRKTAWCNRISAAYPAGWTLQVDSDEFLVWPGMEQDSLPAFLQRAQQAGHHQLRGILLELYPRNALLDETSKPENFRQDYCWFDRDNDTYLQQLPGGHITGGMRSRVFGLPNISLSKTSLTDTRGKGFMRSSHSWYPDGVNSLAPYCFALLHYKFLPGDLARYQRIAREGNYAGGSREYKKYIEVFSANPTLSAWEKDLSVQFTSSDALSALPFIRKI